MKRVILRAVVVAGSITIALVAYAQSPDDDEPTPDEMAAEGTQQFDNARDAYKARLAELGTPKQQTLAQPKCPPGATEWRRGVDVTMCATNCVIDAQCAAHERCRWVDPTDGPRTPNRLTANFDKKRGDRGLCDPFYDIKGVVDPNDMTSGWVPPEE